MIVEGVVKKSGWTTFKIGSIPMTTGNWPMWFTLRELAKTKEKVKIEGVMETVIFKRQFVPVRFV